MLLFRVGFKQGCAAVSIVYTSGFSKDELSEMNALAFSVYTRRVGLLGLNRGGLDAVEAAPLRPTFEERTAGFQEIETDLRAGVERFPESIDLHLLLSQNLKDQGRFEEAAAHMKAQSDRHPGNAAWLTAYATAYLNYGTTNEEKLFAHRRFTELQGEASGLPVPAEQGDVLRRHGGETATIVAEPVLES